MRDKAKDKEYFREMYNSDTKYLNKWLDLPLEPGSNIQSYKYNLFIYAFYKFYSGYSLGLDINELIPEIKLILRNWLDTTTETNSNYEDMEYILHFILLFNQNEFLDEYKNLLEKSEHRDLRMACGFWGSFNVFLIMVYICNRTYGIIYKD